METTEEGRSRADLEETLEVLWHAGVFACELRAVADLEAPAVLCVLKDGEPVIEVPVHSALEAEERAHSLKIVVQRHQPE